MNRNKRQNNEALENIQQYTKLFPLKEDYANEIKQREAIEQKAFNRQRYKTEINK